MGSPFIKFGKLNGLSKLREAIRHNKRAIKAEMGFDSKFSLERCALNHCLVSSGTADETLAEYTKVYKQATGKHPSKGRTNGVFAVEILVSVGPGEPSPDEVFVRALDWVRGRFGCPIISADVHLDEAHPHLHIIILPLIDGRLRGSDLVGGPGKLESHRRSFFAYLGCHQHKVNQRDHKALARAVVKHMLSSDDPATLSPAWELIRSQIESDPVQFGLVYGVTSVPEEIVNATTQREAKKRFVNIMTAPQKLEREKPNNSLSCV